MEQAKAADGYLPKWRSNHLPRQKRGKKAIILTLVVLQCSAAIQQQTVVLQRILTSSLKGELVFPLNFLMPMH